MSNQVQLTSSDHVPIMVGMMQFTPLLHLVFLTRATDRDVIERSVLLKNMIDDLGEAATSEPIPITNVSMPLRLLLFPRLTHI